MYFLVKLYKILEGKSMIVLMIDTCVWLDMAKTPSLKSLSLALKQLVDTNEIVILMTNIIEEEFNRNREKVVDISRQKISQEISNIKSIIDFAPIDLDKSTILYGLDEIKHKLPSMTDTISEQANLVFEIINNSTKVDISDEIKIISSNKAYEKKAPFHNTKNNMADSLLIETFFNILDEENIFYFITHNTKEFSSEKDQRIPHQDFDEFFSKEHIHYSINLHNTINEIAPDTLLELNNEYNWYEEARGFYEIVEEINKLTDIIWYNRHKYREEKINQGIIEIVEEQNYNIYNQNQILKSIWDGALKSAKQKEELYREELIPEDDFEWGMINGKLSALRWVLGDEWDMLDT